jgi:thiamine pyrophosphate-dependent acetolactate synthase large subunit-like protein
VDLTAHEAGGLHVSRFAHVLAARFPADERIVDESLTSSSELMRYLAAKPAGRYFHTGAVMLGAGLPGTIAKKIAARNRLER